MRVYIDGEIHRVFLCTSCFDKEMEEGHITDKRALFTDEDKGFPCDRCHVGTTEG